MIKSAPLRSRPGAVFLQKNNFFYKKMQIYFAIQKKSIIFAASIEKQ